MESLTETSATQNSGGRPIVMVMAGLYCLVCLCLGIVLFAVREQIPGLQNYFPTITPTPTATPIVRQPASGDKVIKDDFSKNTQNWRPDDKDRTVTIKDGRLFLESLKAGRMGSTRCDLCSFAHNSFYIEADFSTDQAIDAGYGLVFNIKNDYDGAYLFNINAMEKRYLLYKLDKSSSASYWTLRLSKNSSLIKPYPQTNKLGILFDKDGMELYINGEMVDRYQDPGTGLASGGFGFHVDNAGFELIVDNLFSYGK